MRPDFLLEAVSPVKVAGRLPESCAGLTHDSRRVTPGAVFFALPGQRTDGARHISDAIRHGASVVVAEPELVEQLEIVVAFLLIHFQEHVQLQ